MTTFLSHKFLPYIILPTRITHHSATCIDHIFTKCPQSLNNIAITSGISFCDISDHLPCLMSVAVDGKDDKRPLTRVFGNVQCQTFNNHMNNVNWEEIYTPAGDWYSAFIEMVKYFHNILFPLVQISRARIKYKPCITSGLKQNIRTKNSLYRDSIRKSTAQKILAYNTYKNRLRGCLKEAEAKYYDELFTNNKDSSYNIWKHLGRIIDPGKHRKSHLNKLYHNEKFYTDWHTVSNLMNDYFSSVGIKLQQQFRYVDNNLYEFAAPRLLISFYISNISIQDIVTEIPRLNTNKAVGFDNIGAKIIRMFPEIFAYNLAKIFNRAIEKAEYPTQLKIARVIALY